MQVEVGSGISIRGLFHALWTALYMILVLFVSFTVFLGSAGLVWYYLMQYTRLLLENVVNYNILLIIYCIEFVMSGLIILVIIYLILRIRYTLGAKVMANIKNYKESLFKKDMTFVKPKRLMFEYTLKSPKITFKQWLTGEPSKEVQEYIRSKYPNWTYKKKWIWGSSAHNFMESLRFMGTVDLDKLDKEPLFLNESMKLRIRNLDNEKSFTKHLSSTQGFLWINKPFHSISNKQIDGICDGKKFEVCIEYKGIRGYSFKLWVI